MIINHMIKDDILYLEIDINYDFGNFNFNKDKFILSIKEYIKNAKLKLRKHKIVILCSGIMIGTILLPNTKTNSLNSDFKYIPSFKDNIVLVMDANETSNQDNVLVEDIINDESSNTEVNSVNKDSLTNTQTQNTNEPITTTPIGPTVTIKRSNSSVITIGLEEYVIGVVGAEMPASFNVEALKAQAVLARTYALKAKETGKTLTDTVSTQAYEDMNQLRSKWGSSFDTYYNKIKSAVNSTSGEYLSYNGTTIEAMYHSTNNGTTESSLDVFGNNYPYLTSVSSPYDLNASSYLRTNTFDTNTINNLLGLSLNSNSSIKIISRTTGNNIKEISIDGKIFTGKYIREKIGLRSADFDIIINDTIVTFTTRGYGHGVGMSQYGANGMANAGYGYQAILSHYYTSIQFKK